MGPDGELTRRETRGGPVMAKGPADMRLRSHGGGQWRGGPGLEQSAAGVGRSRWRPDRVAGRSDGEARMARRHRARVRAQLTS